MLIIAILTKDLLSKTNFALLNFQEEMRSVELNPKGNFDSWPIDKLDELTHGDICKELGQKVLYEDHRTRLWQLRMLPGERRPFTNHTSNYNWECTTGGTLLTRNANGRISLVILEKGESDNCQRSQQTSINDLENLGAETVEFVIKELI